MSSVRSLVRRFLFQPAKKLARPIVRPLRDLFLLPAIQQFRELHERLEVQLREMNETVILTDRTLLGLGLLHTLPPRGVGRLSHYPTRLYVDLRCLQDPFYSFRGIGFHSSGVLRNAKRFLGSSIRIIGLIDPALPKLPTVYGELVDEIRTCLATEEGPAVALHLSPMTADGSWLRALFTRPDIFHCALFYDAIPLEEPDRYLATGYAHRLYVNNLVWLRAVDCYCPISESAAKQLQNLIGSSSDRIAVTGACLRAAFTHFDRSVASNAPFAAYQYFLVVGGGDPRKNVELVLEAHACLKSSLGLVIAGHYEDDHIERLKAHYRVAGGDAEKLHFAKGSSDAQLASLYHCALATVAPSRNEGFSLPVAEALRCGCPVLVSDIPAHRELVSNEEAFFAADDREALMAKLRLFIEKPSTRGDWLAKQKTGPISFAEQDVAGRVWSHVLRFLPPADDPQSRLPIRKHSSKPRLAFLTPLPPEKSGVADYSERTLRALTRYADVDVYANRADCRREPGVRRYEAICEYPYLCNEYDRVVSVIANSSEYNRIPISLLSRFGGPCITHDARMIDFYIGMEGRFRFAERASRWMNRPVREREVWFWYQNQAEMPTLCFEEILLHANPLIVHSRGNRAAIEKQYGKSPAVLPFCPYRSFEEAALTPNAKREARRRLGIAEGTIAIVSLGIVAETKAPRECLDALHLLRAKGFDAELYFVGRDGGVAEFWDEWVTERGLTDKVHFADHWIDESTYRDYALAADLALQLRTHGFGGISGTLADCIAAGITTVANFDLADALDAPNFIHRVGDELDPAQISERLYEAIQSGRHMQRNKEARLEYLQIRNFDAYAQGLLKILNLA